MPFALATSARAQPSQVAARSASSSDKQHAEVLAVVERFHDAIKGGDATLAERVLAADVTIYEQGHREASRAEYLGHHFKEDVAFAKAVPSTVDARTATVSGDLAVATSESSATGVYKDKPVKTANLSTYVLAKRDSGWVIVHVHWSSRRR
jgi:ketosteroid isomerase-like protein